MKQLKLLITTTLIIILLASCQKEPQEQIIGSWEVVNVNSSAKMSKKEKMFFASENKKLKDSTTYIFSKQNMILKYGNQTLNWNYSIIKQDSTLILNINNQSQNQNYKIKEITDDKLILERNIYDQYTVTKTLKKINQ